MHSCGTASDCQLVRQYLQRWGYRIVLHYLPTYAPDTLGLAEERRYRFFAAEKAYARAVELVPDNTDSRRRYDAFLRKVAEDGTEKG